MTDEQRRALLAHVKEHTLNVVAGELHISPQTLAKILAGLEVNYTMQAVADRFAETLPTAAPSGPSLPTASKGDKGAA